MARDPNERIGPGEWLEKPDDFKGKGITPPEGYVIGEADGQYYAHYQIHADGHTSIEWYKRGAGGGKPNPDPVATTTAGTPVPTQKEKWDKGEAAEAKPDQVVTINGVPSQVIGKDAQGRDIWGPVRTETGPATATGTTTGPAAPGGKPFEDDGPEVGAAGRRRGWNPETRLYDRDLGPSPSAQKPPEVKPPTPIAAGTDQPFIVQQMPDGSIRSTPNQNYRGPKPERGTTVTVKGGDGKTYLVPIDAQGNPGKPVESGVPGEGTGPQGPDLPPLVLGQVQEGLRAYRSQLSRLVALGPEHGGISPAVAAARWAEAESLGRTAIEEAKTFEHDEESRRNADVNLRTNAMSNATSGFNSALDFVLKLNATLPEGSTAGGAAFEAILGLQQMQARRMGAYDNPYSNAATPRPLGAASPTGAASPAPPPTPTAPAAQNAGAGTGEPPARGSLPTAAGAPVVAPAPATPSAPGSVAAPAPASPAPPAAVGVNPDAGQGLGPTGNSGPLGPPSAPSLTTMLRDPRTGVVSEVSLADLNANMASMPPGTERLDPNTGQWHPLDLIGSPSPPAAPQPAAPVYGKPGADPTPVNEPGLPPGSSIVPQPAAPLPVPESPAPEAPAAAEPMVTVRNRLNGETVTIPRSRWDNDMNFMQRATWEEVPPVEAPAAPTPTPVAPASGGATTGQLAPPSNEYAALAQFEQPTAPASPQLGAPDPGTGQDMVALRRAQIAGSVPWALSDEDFEWASQNGFLEDARMIPQRRIA